jgi:hypothetical protein
LPSGGEGVESERTRRSDIDFNLIFMAFQTVEVAVTVLAAGTRILAVFNPRWGSFTLPMTRRKKWQDPAMALGMREEDWSVSAARGGAEVLARTLGPQARPQQLMEIKEYRQSGEDGIWKVYQFRIFGLAIPKESKLAGTILTEWLTPAEFADHEPVSSTARYLVSCLQEKGRLPPWPQE